MVTSPIKLSGTPVTPVTSTPNSFRTFQKFLKTKTTRYHQTSEILKEKNHSSTIINLNIIFIFLPKQILKKTLLMTPGYAGNDGYVNSIFLRVYRKYCIICIVIRYRKRRNQRYRRYQSKKKTFRKKGSV